MKKQIDLRAGFLVDSYRGDITKVTYVELPYRYLSGLEQEFLVLNENGEVCLHSLPKNAGSKIFDRLCDAKKYARETKQATAKYIKEKIEYYKKDLEKLEKI